MLAIVTMHQEVTLAVKLPYSREMLHIIPSQVCAGYSTWEVNICKLDVNIPKFESTMFIQVSWKRRSHQDYTLYNWMHIIPRSGFSALQQMAIDGNKLMRGEPIKCVITDAGKVTEDGMLDFDIVFSHFRDIARKLVIRPAPPLRVFSLTNYNIATMFLKDPKSVDVCFLFSADKGVHLTGALWAHRNVLSQHRAFAKLLQEQDAILSPVIRQAIDVIERQLQVAVSPVVLGPVESGRLFIKIDKFTIQTFCALLYYIYTGKSELFVVSSNFVINTWKDSRFLFSDDKSSFCEILRRHYVTQHVHLDNEDVTWGELLEVAVHFGISDLIALCRQ
ncbi:MAG: hypothetical protein J3R72DRAFT_441665 [Linnemannia gamsii]|nr:MAG: hypothetical protein J3R72DRAFT_441665 [Linnemannia gamsii]